MIINPDRISFLKSINATIISVYFLILVGGIVRSTGSGMGCPDWPKCFGNWIPPTSKTEIPDNYKDIYAGKRKVKNQKIASFLRKFNLFALAFKIENDPSIYKEVDFNPVKTWIEYLNRIIGVIVGLLILITTIKSFKFYESDRSMVYLCFLSLIIVILEGWLGSIVVSTNLLPFSITIHMALALMLVSLLIFIKIIFNRDKIFNPSKSLSLLNFLLIIACSLTFCQIIMGTQVREEVDIMSGVFNENGRYNIVNNLSYIFKIHRSFSFLIFIVNSLIIFISLKYQVYDKYYLFIILLILFEIIAGIILAYFSIPPFFQPIHLFLGCLVFGVQIYLVLRNLNNPLSVV